MAIGEPTPYLEKYYLTVTLQFKFLQCVDQFYLSTMKVIGTVCLLICTLIVYSEGYCYIQGKPNPDANGMRCSIGGMTMYPGKTLTIVSKCERCVCGNDGRFSCCGYGIHAGVFAAPSGCKVIAGGPDNCTAVMVKINDESQLC